MTQRILFWQTMDNNKRINNFQSLMRCAYMCICIPRGQTQNTVQWGKPWDVRYTQARKATWGFRKRISTHLSTVLFLDIFAQFTLLFCFALSFNDFLTHLHLSFVVSFPTHNHTTNHYAKFPSCFLAFSHPTVFIHSLIHSHPYPPGTLLHIFNHYCCQNCNGHHHHLYCRHRTPNLPY